MRRAQLFEMLRHFIDGKADDVFKTALKVVEEHVGAGLDAVAARFVERVHLRVVGADGFVAESLEGDVRDDVKGIDDRAIACEHDAGADFVRAAGETAQHLSGFFEVGGFREGLAVDVHQRVGAEREATGF